MKIACTGFYIIFFAVYLFIGLKPAEAISYKTSGYLNIPDIKLVSNVTTLALENRTLHTPDSIVGSFSQSAHKTLLIGHAASVFKRLDQLKINSEIIYNDNLYTISRLETLPKTTIDMAALLSPAAEETLILMTCAGADLGGGDATHRLMITATIKR